MIVAPALRRQGRTALVMSGVTLAVALRMVAGAGHPASSAPAGLLFAVTLLAVAGAAGRRGDLGRLGWSAVVLGAAGGVALVAVSLVGTPAALVRLQAAPGTLAWWVPLITLIAVSEELVLRGTLFTAIRNRRGEAVAVLATAVVFAAIHLPLYGPAAFAVDLAAGLFLGALRVLSRGVTAPAVAHVLADLASVLVA